MKKLAFLFLAVFILLNTPGFSFSKSFGGDEASPFKISYDEGPVKVKVGEVSTILVTFEIPEKFYLYEKSITLTFETQDGVKIGAIQKPESIQKQDPFLEKVVGIYELELDVEVPVTFSAEAPKKITLKGKVNYQGCSHDFCYKEMEAPIEILFELENVSNTTIKNKEGFFGTISSFLKNPDLGNWSEQGFFVLLIISFIWGLLTDLTPCIWPMIPVTLAVIGLRKDNTILKNLWTVFIMVMGMSVSYTVLGVFAIFFSKTFGFQFQSPYFLGFLVILFIAMAASLWGFFEIKIPHSIQNKLGSLTYSGNRGIFIVGLTMGLIASPCVGPFLLPLLATISATQKWSNLIFLVSYAMGMGSIFFVLGSLYGWVKIKLPSGKWNLYFKRIIAIFVLVVAGFYAQILVGYFKTTQVENKSVLQEALTRAQAQNKPVVIDFFAESCLPCKELDANVWSQNEIEEELKANWVFVKIDCTFNTKSCEEAVNKYQVIGWPTVIFLNEKQDELKDKKIVGKAVSKEKMLEILLTSH